jgi:ribosome biogenesis protein ERB1
MDGGDKPFKALRYHSAAVRGAGYHPRYPLFASASDDGTAQVFHGMVRAVAAVVVV